MKNDYFAEIGLWSEGTGIGTYVIGLFLSLALTLGAYGLAVNHLFSFQTLVAALIVLALVQFIVQGICFLHLGGRGASRERFAIFAAAGGVALILVSGSLWIMFTLSGRMMMAPSTDQMTQYMQDQGGF